MQPIKNLMGEWVFQSGKYAGRTFQEVAQINPDYLVFVYWNLTVYWCDEAVWALQDVLAANSISYQ